MEEESLNDLKFDSRRAPKPQLLAVTELAEKLGRELTQMDTLTMGEIVELAKQTYGKKLPDYWQVWLDWSQNNDRPEMGDL